MYKLTVPVMSVDDTISLTPFVDFSKEAAGIGFTFSS